MLATTSEAQVLYSAVTFRFLLDSLARPGKITSLAYPAHLVQPSDLEGQNLDAPLNFYALGAMLSLLDREVTFTMAAGGQWLLSEALAVRWVALRSGSGLDKPEQAAFAYFCDGQCENLLPLLHSGTLLEPELSATAFICVDHLSTVDDVDAPGMRLELSGPGIETTQQVAIQGISQATIAVLQSVRRSYPLGIDAYLIDVAGHCLGLSRTTGIRIVEREKER